MENEEQTMSEQSQAIPFVKSIFHPSDFSEASELAFAHALAIALIGETQLVIMHARRGEREDWSQFPAVRKTLARWQVLEAGSLPSEVFQDRKSTRLNSSHLGISYA